MKPEPIFIPGPVGQIEALVQPVADSSSYAIICHPHPLYQGTMHNKVVTTLAKAFELMGVSSIRFNYRGVGNSDGSYGNISGEIADCEAVLAYAQQRFDGQQRCLAGFSFGSFISASVANVHGSHLLISVAPAVNHADYQSLTAIRSPWLVVMGEQDEVVPFAEVAAWAQSPPALLQFEVFNEATHFFHGQLIHLRQCVIDFCQPVLKS